MIKPLSKSRLTETRLSKQLGKQETDTEIFNLDSIIPLRVGELAGNVLPELTITRDIVITNNNK
jgi:hypothetical protein